VINFVKTFRNIGIQHIFRFELNSVENCLNRIMGVSSWSKTEGVWLEASLPFGFQG